MLVSAAVIVVRVGVRLSLVLFDLGQYVALAGISYVACRVWNHWRSPRRAASFLALAVPMNALGWLTLPLDLTNFSERQADLGSPALILALGVTFLGTSPAIAWLLGRVCARPKWRFAALAASSATLIANHLLLRGDYDAIHLFVLLCASMLASSAFHGMHLPRGLVAWRISSTARRRLQAVLAFAAACFAVLSPPPDVRTLWEQQGIPLFGIALAPIRATLITNSSRKIETGADEWWQDRSGASAIPPTRSDALPRAPVVVIISVDALRADLVAGAYDASLPNLARIRDESIWFQNAYAPGTLTKVSIASIFMGKYFSQQYWSEDDRGALLPFEDQTPRFPELLGKAGVLTVNYHTINWLRSPNAHVRGFKEEKFVKYPKNRSYYTPAKPLMAKFLPRVRRSTDKPHFFFTHLSDPHAPYSLGKREGAPFERYLSEVQLVDAQLARVLLTLQAVGLSERAILIVTSDHGEAFGEHGAETHGTTLYEEELRVPLLVRVPGTKGRSVAQLVTLLDLGPTVLDLFRHPTPGYFMGQSLVPFLIGQSPTLTRPVAAEARLKQAMIFADGMKVIYDTRTGRSELYDLRRDPRETQDLSGDEEKLREPLERLRSFFDAHAFRANGYRPPFVR